ncbi:MAG: sulfur carrier protein ThiS adenylyltransferase [Candidatus Saccharibacteria bacterium]|nr:sulfur carrier protein ThiS adenylyltransferase [Candidatus Saccharibacteria bacterium]
MGSRLNVDYRDQRAIFDPDKFTWPVHVIGVGGIGSALLYPLVKLGVSQLHLWDHDAVEPHNIPAQLIYRPSDVGLNKVEAAMHFLERQEADCKVVQHEEYVTSETALEGVVFSCVDSMSSRSDIWEAVKYNPLVPFYLDGRIGGEQLQLLCVNPSNFDETEFYEKWLFPDSEGMELPCAARTVIHPAGVLANLMVAQLTLFLREEAYKLNLTAHLKAMQFAAA